MESVLLLLILLLLSFVFSGYETSFFSISSVQRERISVKYPHLNLQALQDDKGTLLNVLLLMNLLVNTLSSFIFAHIVEVLYKVNGLPQGLILFYQIGAFFVILLIFGEITPKVIAINNPSFFIIHFSAFIYATYRLTGWFTRPLSLLFNKIFSSLWHSDTSKEALFNEIKVLFPDVCGVFTGLSLIRGSIRRLVKDKRHVVHFALGMTQDEMDNIVKNHPHSMYPVIKEDEVVKLADMRKSNKTQIFFEDPMIVPDTITLLDYLKEVRRELNGFRIVVSESGEYIGIATLDDIINVLSPKTNIKKVKDRVFITEGRAYIEDVERRLGIVFNTESETLMGYLMEKTGRILEEGEKVVIDGVKFEVLLKEKGYIKLLRMELL